MTTVKHQPLNEKSWARWTALGLLAFAMFSEMTVSKEKDAILITTRK